MKIYLFLFSQNDSFQCASGHCIASYLRCDGSRDCRDMSDEVGCQPRYPGGRYCPQSHFECANKICVSLSDRCDGADDCGDGSDENPSMCGGCFSRFQNIIEITNDLSLQSTSNATWNDVSSVRITNASRGNGLLHILTTMICQ